MNDKEKAINKEKEAILRSLGNAVDSACRTCESKGYEYRFLLSFYVSHGYYEERKFTELDNVFGEKKVILKILKLLKNKVNAESGKFINLHSTDFK